MVNMRVGNDERGEHREYRALLFTAVTFICDHPDIRAISFVGSDTAVRIPLVSFETDSLFNVGQLHL